MDAAGGQPIADPQIMRAAREGHGRLDLFACGSFRIEGGFQPGCVKLHAGFRIFLCDRNALAVVIETREDRHRHGLVVLRYVAGVYEIGERRENMGAVDAVCRPAKHEVVAGCTPGCLLGHIDVGKAMLFEQAFFLGNDQRRGIR